MKKIINLVPPSIKHERNIKKAQMSIVYIALGCAGSAFGFNQYEKYVKNQIEELNTQISDYKSKESEVVNLQTKIDATIEQKNSISSSSFPYHRFLYFLTVSAEDDMRILSVQSISPSTEKAKVDEEKTSNPSTNADGQSTQQAETQTTNSGETAQQPADNQGGALLDTPEGQTNTQTSEGVPATSESEPSQNGEETNENSSSPFNFETSVIYVRGYSIYPDSIAILANKLKEEEYIENVSVTKIDDYFTGLNNYKLFEMKITYQ